MTRVIQAKSLCTSRVVSKGLTGELMTVICRRFSLQSFIDYLNSLSEVIKEENEEEDHHEAPESTNENTSDNIEVIDVVLDGTFTKQMNQFPATPIFHGGNLLTHKV